MDVQRRTPQRPFSVHGRGQEEILDRLSGEKLVFEYQKGELGVAKHQVYLFEGP